VKSCQLTKLALRSADENAERSGDKSSFIFSLGVTAESLRAKRDRKSAAISLQRGQFDPKFQVEGVAPTNHFCTDG